MKPKTKTKRRQGLTTEEASRVLGVSIHTVIIYLNRGILKGWKHPVTGYRVVDRESVKSLVALSRKRTSTIRMAVDKAVNDLVRRRRKKRG